MFTVADRPQSPAAQQTGQKMAKSTDITPAEQPDEIDELLIDLAEMLLSEHFFDPDAEKSYKQRLSEDRRSGGPGIHLAQSTFETPVGDCDVRIDSLPVWTQLRVILSHEAFTATVEGSWSFATETLKRAKTTRTGDDETLESAAAAMSEEIQDGDLDDEEFADFLAGIEDDDDEEFQLIGDDPTEPPAATALDRNRIKSIAKRIARRPEADVNVEDRGWLEQTPQVLPVITDLLVDASRTPERDEPLMIAYQTLLEMQLAFVRYRQDRGWDWANEMLETFLRRLVALGKDDTIPREDWLTMCAALTQARVPVSDGMQTALAEAGFVAGDPDEPPEHLLRVMRGFMDELADMVASPFDVISSLQNGAAMLPAMLRAFMATELALSPHQVLRDAVPLMLLDSDHTVRRAAAAALEQTARPETMSPDALRRAIAVRNWLPAADRPALDAAVRKARLAGVAIGAWPAPVTDLEFHASTIDGSGAQSIFAVSRLGKKGFFGGLLLRHGMGVQETWADPDLSRSKINKLLREAQRSAASFRVDKPFVDTIVQHAIGTAVHHDDVPPTMLLEMAELFGGAEWKDHRLDMQTEADRLFGLLAPEDRTPEGIDTGWARGLEWMVQDDVFSSWFEDGPKVQEALAGLARTDQPGMTAAVLADVIPARRAEWTERFLMMALWSQAASDTGQQAKARDLVLVAHALAGDTPLHEIPIMAVIAMQTVRAMLLGAW